MAPPYSRSFSVKRRLAGIRVRNNRKRASARYLLTNVRRLRVGGQKAAQYQRYMTVTSIPLLHHQREHSSVLTTFVRLVVGRDDSATCLETFLA